MKKNCIEFYYDLREAGMNIFAIPVILAFYVCGAFLFHRSLSENDYITMALLELIVPFSCGYAAIMLMQGVLDTDGCEIVFTYPRTAFYWGVYRQLRFFLAFSVLIILVCWCVGKIMRVSFLCLTVLTLLQSIAVMAISFLGITLAKSVGVGIVILLAFIGVQITLGREFTIFNWLFILDGRFPTETQIFTIGIRSFVITICSFPLGHLWTEPAEG